MSGARVSAALLALVVVTLAACGGQDADVSGGQDADVSGSVPSERIESYEAMTVEALGQVEELWGADSVSRPVEVVLPASGAEFEALTGVFTAVPATTVGSLQEARVVVHPDSWGLLTPEGRQAVLTHEVTHLSQQGDGTVPAWLGEGLAEYTAHRDSDLPPTTLAGSALDDVRAGVLPSTWPDPAAAGTSWDGYALSWLACLYIAETWSESALLELYETVAAGTVLSEAVPVVLNMSEAELLTGWAQWLENLA